MDDFARAVCVAVRVGEEARGLGLGTRFIGMGEEEVRRISPNVRTHARTRTWLAFRVFEERIMTSCIVLQLRLSWSRLSSTRWCHPRN